MTPITSSGGKVETIHFHDEAENYGEKVDSQPDNTFQATENNDVTLQQFFSRPIVVSTIVWGVGTNLADGFNPWTLYFSNPRVINRISNYANLRCKLHLKAIVNGTPFHYGRVLVSYHPLFNLSTMSPKSRALFPLDAIGESQRPHFFIDPAQSEGGSLELPFFWMKNALSVVNAEWAEMGQVYYRSLNSLLHANGGTEGVTIRFFVWATDVHLSVPTTAEPSSIVPQSDEYADAPVSNTANAVKNAATALTHVPLIGPYARATASSAAGVAEIAKLFGMSKPTNVENLQRVDLQNGSLSQTIGSDNSRKLTLDPKQEVTIDPRTVGLSGVDEMAFRSITKRESYLTTFNWPGSAGADTLLWNSAVTPVLAGVSPSTGEIHMTPMCWVSQPFRYWRGTINFRFQVVCSQMHKGRIRFKYEPTSDVFINGSEFNVAYSRIIDIGSEKDFTISVGWGQTRSYLQINPIDSSTVHYGNTPLTFSGGINGVLQAYVLSSLATPSTSGETIYINVFVSAGDDFEVMDPTDSNISTLSYFPPGITPESSENLSEQTGSVTIGLKENNIDSTPQVYHGDPVTSWRQCIKRYCLHKAQVLGGGSVDTGTSRRISIGVGSILPNYRGYDPSGTIASSLGSVNYSFMTILNYVVPSYLGWRGSIRWKFASSLYSQIGAVVLVTRQSESQSTGQTKIDLVRDDFERIMCNNYRGSWSGGSIIQTAYNPVVEAEFPYYNDERFIPARASGVNTGALGGCYRLISYGGTGAGLELMNFVSAGEDFSTYFFLNVPIMWRIISLPE
jgi:hypothetical protein